MNKKHAPEVENHVFFLSILCERTNRAAVAIAAAIVFGIGAPAAQAQLNPDLLRNASKQDSARNSPTKKDKDKDDGGKNNNPLSGAGQLRPLSSSSNSNAVSPADPPAAEVAAAIPPMVFGTAPFDLAVLQPLFKTPEVNAETDAGPVLLHEAEKTLRDGDQATAEQLMFGHMAAEYEDALPTLSKVKFSKLLRRPVWSIRFGVSMWVRDGGIGDQHPNPIPPEGGARGGSARRLRAASSGIRPREISRLPSLSDALGAGADRRRGRASTNRSRRSGTAAKSRSNARASSNARAPSNARARNTGNKSETESALARQPVRDRKPAPKPDPTLEEMLGLVAEIVGDEFSVRYENGDFGCVLIFHINQISPAPQGCVNLI